MLFKRSGNQRDPCVLGNDRSRRSRLRCCFSLSHSCRRRFTRPSCPPHRGHHLKLVDPGPGGGGGGGNKSPDPSEAGQVKLQERSMLAAAKPPTVPIPEPVPVQRIPVPLAVVGASRDAWCGASQRLATSSDEREHEEFARQRNGNGRRAGPGLRAWAQAAAAALAAASTTSATASRRRSSTYEPKPKYTADAMRAKVQGTVEMSAVVLPDGTVTDIQIVRSLDQSFGLDEEAKKTASAVAVPAGDAQRRARRGPSIELTSTRSSIHSNLRV